jgi:hypothetical protein
MHLDAEKQKFLTTIPVGNSIYVIEENCRDRRNSTGDKPAKGMTRPLPIELIAWFQPQIQGQIVQIWGEPNMGEYETILIAVRSRLQDWS